MQKTTLLLELVWSVLKLLTLPLWFPTLAFIGIAFLSPNNAQIPQFIEKRGIDSRVWENLLTRAEAYGLPRAWAIRIFTGCLAGGGSNLRTSGAALRINSISLTPTIE